MRMRSSILVLLALVFSCAGGRTHFLEEAKKAAPAFAPAQSTTQGLEVAQTQSPLLGDAVLNAMYQLLRDYEYPRDEGRVDLTNLYKELHTVDETGERARGGCASIAEQPVVAPFDVGPGPTYTCMGNDVEGERYRYGYALKDSGSTTYALLAFRWSPDPREQRSLGQIQGHFDTSSHQIAFTLVNFVEYPAGSTMGGASGSGFTVRTDLEGNSATHTFTLRALVGSLDKTSWTSLVGSGVSRGAGQHFLFRAAVAGGTSEPQERFYCLPSDTDETGLGAMAPESEGTVSEACAHLAPAVEALVSLTPEDAPLSASEFAGGDVGVTAAGR